MLVTRGLPRHAPGVERFDRALTQRGTAPVDRAELVVRNGANQCLDFFDVEVADVGVAWFDARLLCECRSKLRMR